MSRHRVLVTRGDTAAEALAGLIQKAGAECLVAPAIRVIATFDPAVVSRAMEASDVVILASRHPLVALGGGRRDHLDVWAVGEATARAARGRGFDVRLVGDSGLDELVISIVDSGETARRIFWPCGDLSRATALDPLEAAGHRVRRMVVYENENPWAAGPPEGIETVDAAVFASPSAVMRVVTALDRDAVEHARSTWECAAIGRTTGAALRDAGFVRVVVAEEPSNAGLVKTLFS